MYSRRHGTPFHDGPLSCVRLHVHCWPTGSSCPVLAGVNSSERLPDKRMSLSETSVPSLGQEV